MNFDTVMRLIGKWGGTLKFFPSDDMARIGIAEEIAQMAATEDQVAWLVSRIPKLYKEWPAIVEVRAVFCSKYKPKDGIEMCSEVYIDGIPSEKEVPPLLTGVAPRALPAPEGISAAKSVHEFVLAAAKSKNMNRIGAAPKVPDIPVVRVTSENAITQTDIDRAVQELRKKRAAAELTGADFEAVNEKAAK